MKTYPIIEKYPRLNDFPDDAPEDKLRKYTEELIEWAAYVEDELREVGMLQTVKQQFVGKKEMKP